MSGHKMEGRRGRDGQSSFEVAMMHIHFSCSEKIYTKFAGEPKSGRFDVQTDNDLCRRVVARMNSAKIYQCLSVLRPKVSEPWNSKPSMNQTRDEVRPLYIAFFRGLVATCQVRYPFCRFISYGDHNKRRTAACSWSTAWPSWCMVSLILGRCGVKPVTH